MNPLNKFGNPKLRAFVKALLLFCVLVLFEALVLLWFAASAGKVKESFAARVAGRIADEQARPTV